jgi:hypothetical protein
MPPLILLMAIGCAGDTGNGSPESSTTSTNAPATNTSTTATGDGTHVYEHQIEARPYGPHNHELSLPRPFVIVRLSPTLRAPVFALRA